MSYDCPMLFCIKVSLFEPISIRYTLKSLIRMAKQQNLEKIKPQFLKIFWEFCEKSFFAYGVCIRVLFPIKLF